MLTVVTGGYVYYKLNSMYTPDSNISSDEEAVELEKANGIKNILLIGVDGVNLEKGNRSDSMMILTIDEKNKNLKANIISKRYICGYKRT